MTWADEVAKLISSNPATLTYKAASASCTKPIVRDSRDVTGDGLLDAVACDVTYVASDLSEQPKIGAVVSVGGEKYAVIDRSTYDGVVTLGLRRI